MNPFDLSGPAFLVFYICVALIVIIALKLATDEAEGGAPRALPLNDPYQSLGCAVERRRLHALPYCR